MTNWPTTTLANGDYFHFLNGLWKGKKPPYEKAVVIRNTNFKDGGILDLSDVAVLEVESRQLEKRRLEQGDIIIERSGGGPKQAVGRVCFFDENGSLPFSFSNFTSVLRIKDHSSFVPKFVHYYLLSLYNDGFTIPLQRATTGIRNLDFEAYTKAEIPKMPLEEQEKISSLLRKIQQAIILEEKLIANVNELKGAAMQKVFSCGLHEADQKETEIGDMPKSWNVYRVSDKAKLIAGGTPSRTEGKYWANGTIPWVKTGEVDYCVVNDTEEKITQEGMENSSAKLLPAGALLVAMYGQGITRGKVAILGIDATTNQACVGLIPKSNDLFPKYLYYYLSHSYERLRSLSHGAQQQNLNKELVGSFQFPFPEDRKEQEEIAELLETIDKKIFVHEKRHRLLKDLFQTLLHQLMTGQVRVVDLEIDISDITS